MGFKNIWKWETKYFWLNPYSFINQCIIYCKIKVSSQLLNKKKIKIIRYCSSRRKIELL
jgi:hypothetical protein